jgi:hypothetical protein
MQFYDISKNVFKIIADQGANVKKAFKETRECDNTDEIIKLAKDMLEEQRKIDLKIKQEEKRIELEKEIEVANAKIDDNQNGRKRKRDEIINSDLFDDIDFDYTDSASDDGDSLLDADELEENFNSFSFFDEISKRN